MKYQMKKLNKIKTSIMIAAFLFSFNLFIGFAHASEITSGNVLKLINNERASRGIPKLQENPDLDHAAVLKTKDMLNRNYFEHYAYGLAPWDFIHISGYDYLYAGENLAMDFHTSEGMVNAWMNSAAHRDNILNPDFTETGLGVVKGEFEENGSYKSTVMVTNMFGRKKPAILKAFDFVTKNILGF